MLPEEILSLDQDHKELFNALVEFYDRKSQEMIASDYFTPHDSSHCRAVEDIIKKLIKNSEIELSELENFLLIISIWTHDIGMFQDISHKYLDNEFTIDKARDVHDEISAWFINNDENFRALFKDMNDGEFRKLIHTVNIICKYHRRKRDVNECPKIRRLNDNQIVNTRLLSCLLRFGDTLHVESSRFDKRIYDILQIGDFDRTARLHWLKSYLVSAINLDISKQIIYITIDLPESTKGKEQELADNAERLKFFIYEDILEDKLAVSDTFREYNYKFYSSIVIDINHCPGYQDEMKEEVFGIINDLGIVTSPNTTKVITKTLDSISSLSNMNFDRYELFHNQMQQLIKNLKKIHSTRPCHVGLGKIISIIEDAPYQNEEIRNAPLEDMDKVKKYLITSINEIRDDRKKSKEIIEAKASETLKGMKNIFLIGFSEMVLGFLTANKDGNFKKSTNFFIFELEGKKKLSMTNRIEYSDGVFYSTCLSRAGFEKISIHPAISFASVITDIMANMQFSAEDLIDPDGLKKEFAKEIAANTEFYKNHYIKEMIISTGKCSTTLELIQLLVKMLNKIIEGDYYSNIEFSDPIIPKEDIGAWRKNHNKDVYIKINRTNLELKYGAFIRKSTETLKMG